MKKTYLIILPVSPIFPSGSLSVILHWMSFFVMMGLCQITHVRMAPRRDYSGARTAVTAHLFVAKTVFLQNTEIWNSIV